jgi:hypothetical protein
MVGYFGVYSLTAAFNPPHVSIGSQFSRFLTERARSVQIKWNAEKANGLWEVIQIRPSSNNCITPAQPGESCYLSINAKEMSKRRVAYFYDGAFTMNSTFFLPNESIPQVTPVHTRTVSVTP